MIVRLLWLIGFLLLRTAAEAASPTISNSNTGSQTGGTSQTVSITASAGDVIVVTIFDEATGSPSPTSSVSGLSLTWNQYFSSQNTMAGCNAGSTTCYSDFEIYCAYSAASQASQTATITYSKTIDDAVISWFSVSAVHAPTSPCAGSSDSNVGFPYSAKSTATDAGGSTTLKVSGVNTSQADDLIVGVAGVPFADTISFGHGTCSGMTTDVTSGGTNGGSNAAHMSVISQSESGTVTNLTGGWGFGSGPPGCASRGSWIAAIISFTADSLSPPRGSGWLLMK